VIVDVKTVPPSLKHLFQRALRVLVDAHSRSVGVVLQILQLLRNSQRRVLVEGKAEQAVSGVPRGVLEHSPLPVCLVAIFVLKRCVVSVDVRQPVYNSVLAGAYVTHGRPAAKRFDVVRPFEGDVVAHRAYPILMAVTGLMIGYSR